MTFIGFNLLTNRKLKYDFEQVKGFRWAEIKAGLSLGPLFLIYVNDLPKILDSSAKAVLFADDTSILISKKDTLNDSVNNVNHLLRCQWSIN